MKICKEKWGTAHIEFRILRLSEYARKDMGCLSVTQATLISMQAFVVFFKLNGRNMDVKCIHYFSSP